MVITCPSVTVHTYEEDSFCSKLAEFCLKDVKQSQGIYRGRGSRVSGPFKVYGGGDEAGDCGGVASNAESSAGIDLNYRLIRRPLELWTRPT
jgi:hypothetical protein